jgi:glutathione S-transferase
MISIDVPDKYPLIILINLVGPSFVNFALAGYVMGARKRLNVQYPNLYATPGYHDKADEFNRIQRGHQHLFESISDFRTCSLVAGLKFPVLVIVCGVLYNVGNYMYMLGYKDTKLDVATARLKKGGFLAFFADMVLMLSAAWSALSLCDIV